MCKLAWFIAILLALVVLHSESVCAQQQPSISRVLPVLSGKYKYLKELEETTSTLQLEIQALKSDPNMSSDEMLIISKKQENIQEIGGVITMFEKEIRAMEKIILRDGSIRSCLDVSKAIKTSSKNLTTGEYPIVEKDYIKKTLCVFESTEIITPKPAITIQEIKSIPIDIPLNGMSTMKVSDARYSDIKTLYKPNFSVFKGLREERGVISKKAAASDWDASFFSKEQITEDSTYQGITFIAGQNTLHLVVGLSMKEVGQAISDMNFAISLSNDQNYYIYEKGSNIGTFGRYEEGDEFRIGLCMGKMMCYFYNGKVFYTSRSIVYFPLYIDSAFLNNGARILDLAFYEPLQTEPKIVDINQAVNFKNVKGCVANAGFVKKNFASSSFDSGVSSSLSFGNSFISSSFTKEEKEKASRVGGFSFKVGEIMQYAVIGLSNQDNSYDPSEILFGVMLNSNGFVYIYEKGETYGPLQTYFKSDIFTIQLVQDENAGSSNNRVIYTHNGQPFYFSRKTASLPLVVDVSMATQYANVYDLTWIERYELKNTKVAESEKVEFPYLRGLYVNEEGVLSKFLRTDGFNSFASSDFTITDKSDVKGFEFKVNQNHIAMAFGLSNKNSDDSFKNIDFGIFVKSDKSISVIEDGNIIPNMGFYEKGDKFSVYVKKDARVGVLQNGEEIFTSQQVAKFPLKILTTMEKMEGTVSKIMYVADTGILVEAPEQVKPGQPVYWKHVHGVKSKPGYQRKTLSTEGWNAGSFSIHSITENSLIGGITFKPNGINKQIMIGLTSAKSHTTYQAIDKVLSFSGNQFSVYEKGSSRGVFGTYNINDKFEISVSQDNSQVVFLQNNVIFYTSFTSQLPLFVDNSFYSLDGCLFDIMYTPKYIFNQTGASVSNPVYFKSINGLDVSKAGSISKTKDTNGWDAFAFSSVGIPSPDSKSTNQQVYGIEFVASTKKNAFVSLSNIDTKDLSQDYALRINPQSTVQVMEKGSIVYTHNKNYETGDKFSIYVSNNVITYSLNGINIYSSRKTPTYPLGVGVAIVEPGPAIEKLSFITNENEPPKSSSPNQKVFWNYIIGCTSSPGFVFKHIESNSMDAFATSSHFIDTQSAITNYNNVGGFSFKATQISSYIGLTDVQELGSANSLQYSIYLDSGYIYIFEKGQMKGSFHTYTKDDEFSIRITTNYDNTRQTVVYSHNGNVFYSSQNRESVSLPSKLYVGAVLVRAKSNFVDITWVQTFEPEEYRTIKAVPEMLVSNFSNIVGMERIGREKGNGPITIRRNRPSSEAFFYTSRKYFSEKSEVDGFSFKAVYSNFAFQIGFTMNTDIAIGIYIRSDKYFSVMISGSDLGIIGEYTDGDEFSLISLPTGKKNERSFVFLKNGMVFYANPKKVMMGPFGISANFIHNGAAITNLKLINSSIIGSTSSFKPNGFVQWEYAYLVESKDGQAFKSYSTDSWNSGVISRSEFFMDDDVNGVSFIASQPSGQVTLTGLSNDPDGSFSIGSVDFAILLSYNQAFVYEKNTKITGIDVNFRRGDSFEIKIVNGSVYYSKNGTIFYTSKVAPKFPLKVQASFNTVASQVTEVKWTSKPTTKL